MTRRGFTAWPFELRPTRIAVIAAYAATVAIWGTTWLAIKIGVREVPPVTGVGLRFVLAAAVLYAVALLLRVDLRTARPPLGVIAVLAVTMFGVNYALTYVAETHLASGLVAVLYGTLPFFVFAMAHRMVGERITGGALAGTALALTGVGVISLTGNVTADGIYVAAALAATAISAFGNVYLKRFAHAEPLATLPPAMLLAGVTMTLGGALFEHADWHRALSPPSLLAIAYLAVLGSAVAFYLNHWLLRRIDSGAFALSALMIPVVAVAVGVAFGGEHFGVRDIGGGALVLAGLWFALRPGADRGEAPELQPELAA